MKKVKLFCLTACIFHGVYAQIDGPFGGGTFSNVTISGSNKPWVNTSNASLSDNVYTTFGNLSNPGGTYTDYLQVTGFGFNLPSTVVINGIILEIERSDPGGRTADYAISIVKGGVISTTNRSSGAAYSLTDSYQTFGSAGDLWGETWTPADINSANFGIAIAAQRVVSGGSTAAARIDHVRITVFYDFIVTPVKLISFSADKKNKNVEVKWTTAEEVNMDHYDVERSPDGSNFTTIGTVMSQEQLLQTEYVYTDKAPVSGVSYYRLKMAGTAGDIRYSKIVSVQFAEETGVRLYPNPLQQGQALYIVNPRNEKVTIVFYNVTGQLLANIVTSGSTIPVQRFQSQRGIVFYKIFEKNGDLALNGKLLLQ